MGRKQENEERGGGERGREEEDTITLIREAAHHALTTCILRQYGIFKLEHCLWPCRPEA